MRQAIDGTDPMAPLPPGRFSAEGRVWVVFGTAAVVLVLMNYATIDVSVQVGASEALIAWIGALSPDLDARLLPYRGLVGPLVWAAGCVTCYFVVPALVVRTVLGHELRTYGLRLEGLREHVPLFLACYVPLAIVIIAAAQTPAFQQYYPFYRDPVGLWDAAIWGLLYGAQFFALEFFFRGFLLHGAADVLGRHVIIVMAIPYVMIHFPKPLFEASGAFFAAIFLGILSLRTGSIALGVALHVAVGWTMEVAASMAINP
jgi:membrane protease YdiL (CAAX protease family)